MSHLVFNSFPRSGQVFLTNVANRAFSMPMSSAHLPEIFGVSELFHVSIFRKPEDAIASMVNQTRQGQAIDSHYGGYKGMINEVATRGIKTYDSYLENVEKNLDKVKVVLFSDLELDYQPVIKSIAERFSLSINPGYQSNVSLDPSSPIWSDKYDGHLPRGKDEIRLEIESAVASMENVKMLNDRYLSFLKKI
jgi:hypothetical protein